MDCYSGTTLTFVSGDFIPADGVNIFVYASRNDLLILDRTNSSGDDVDIISLQIVLKSLKMFTTATDQIVLEFDTFANLSVPKESGKIQKVFVSKVVDKVTQNYQLFLLHPHLERTVLSATTENISVKPIKINDGGFNGVSGNPPDATFRFTFVLKDVSGTFANGNTLLLILEQ